MLVLSNLSPTEDLPYAGWYVRAHAERLRSLGFRIRELPAPPGRSTVLKYLVMALRAGRTALAGQFDLIHAHWVLPSGLFASLLAHWLRLPLLVTSHGAFVRDYRRRSPITRRLIRWVLRGADRVVAVGKSHGEDILSILEGDRIEIQVIPMGVVWPQSLLSMREARSQLGLPASGLLIGYLGNLEVRKGVHILLRAAARLRDTGLPFTLRIVGGGSQADELAEIATSLGLRWPEIYLGPLAHEKVGLFYRACDLMVVPSLSEPFGLVAFEAMASGRAVIAADVGGLRENIEHEKTGLLVAAGDENALTLAMQRLCRDPQLREALGRDGRRAARAFDIESQARAVGEIYLELAAESMDGEA